MTSHFSLTLLVLLFGAGTMQTLASTSPPSNDAFDQRIVLEGIDLDVWGTNINASVEPGENTSGDAFVPALDRTIWWSWTAPADGVLLSSVQGSSFRALLRIYQGDILTNLVIRYSESGLSFGQDYHGIHVTAGTTYAIQVGGVAVNYPTLSSGAVRLKLSWFQAPANDDFSQASPIASIPFSTNASTVDAGIEADEPLLGGAGAQTVWWTWTAASSGPETATLQANPPLPQDEHLPVLAESGLAVYTGDSWATLTPVGQAIGQDVWKTALSQVTWDAIAGTTYHIQVRGTFPWLAGYVLNLAATRPPEVSIVEPIGPWDQSSSIALHALAVAADSDGSIDRVEFFLYNISLEAPAALVTDTTPPYQASFSEEPSSCYWLLVRAWDNQGAMADAVPRSIHVRPVNDDFASRIPLSGSPVCSTGRVLNASLEPSESTGTDGTVWWSWTAPDSGAYLLRTSTEQFASAWVKAYTGDSLEMLQLVATSTSTPNYKLSLPAEAGTTYQLAVSGGSIDLRLLIATATAPEPVVTFPAYNEVLALDASWAIEVHPQDPDQTVVAVDLMLDDQWIATLNGPPFTWLNTGLIPPGDHYVRGVAVDACGLRYVGQNVEFRIINSPPPNDDFADRISMAGASWQTQGTVGDATRELAETGSGDRSLWWSLTAPTSGPCVLQTRSSLPFDITFPEVYVGEDLGTLTWVSEEVEYFQPNRTRTLFQAEAGTTYAIRLAGYSDREVAELELIPTAPPTVAITSPEEGQLFLEGALVTLASDPQDPDGSIAAVEFYLDEELVAVVTSPPFELVVPATHEFYFTAFAVQAVDDQGAYSLPVYSGFEIIPVSNRPPNDEFADSIPISGVPVTVSGPTAWATEEPGEPMPLYHRETVWWTWTAPTSGVYTVRVSSDYNASPSVVVATGSVVDQLTTVAHEIFQGENSGYAAQATFTAEAGVPYHLSVSMTGAGVPAQVLVAPGTPPTVELLDPMPGETFMEGVPVTLEAQPVDDGAIDRVEFLVSGGVKVVAENAPYQVTLPSFPPFHDQVHIRTRVVDEWGLDGWGAEVFVNQTPAPPPNDDFADRPIWQDAYHAFAGTFRAASNEPDEPELPGLEEARSLWWQWTPPMNGQALLTLQAFALAPAVFAGSELESLVPVQVFSSTPDNLGMQYVFEVRSGTTYQLALYDETGFDIEFSASLFLDARYLEAPMFAPGTDLTGVFLTTHEYPWQIERALQAQGPWSPILTNQPVAGRIEFADPDADVGPVFYRARSAE